MTFKKDGEDGHIQVHPEIGERICSLEVKERWK
jgi:hypothetical protein